MRNPPVSVVIITMNRPVELQNCITSCLSQMVSPKEIIVIDASGGYETQFVLEKMSASSKIPLGYFRTKPGTGHQRKLGVEKSQGDIVLFVDDDVCLEENFIRDILKIFEKHWNVIGGVTGHDIESRRLSRFDFKTVIRTLFFLPDFGCGWFKLSSFHTTANGLKGIRRVEYMGGAFTAYRRSVLEEFPPDHERFSFFFEDADLSFRISRKYQNYYCASALCRHLPSPINRKSVRDNSDDLLKAYRLFWEKNSPKRIVHRVAYWLACFGIRHKLIHMTFRDLASQCFRRVFPRKSIVTSQAGTTATSLCVRQR